MHLHFPPPPAGWGSVPWPAQWQSSERWYTQFQAATPYASACASSHWTFEQRPGHTQYTGMASPLCDWRKRVHYLKHHTAECPNSNVGSLLRIVSATNSTKLGESNFLDHRSKTPSASMAVVQKRICPELHNCNLNGMGSSLFHKGFSYQECTAIRN